MKFGTQCGAHKHIAGLLKHYKKMLLSRKTCCPVFDGCPFKYTSFQEHRCSFVACWFFFVLFANVLVRCLYEESTLVIISLTILKSWLLIWWQCSLLNISSILLKNTYIARASLEQVTDTIILLWDMNKEKAIITLIPLIPITKLNSGHLCRWDPGLFCKRFEWMKREREVTPDDFPY